MDNRKTRILQIGGSFAPGRHIEHIRSSGLEQSLPRQRISHVKILDAIQIWLAGVPVLIESGCVENHISLEIHHLKGAGPHQVVSHPVDSVLLISSWRNKKTEILPQ